MKHRARLGAVLLTLAMGAALLAGCGKVPMVAGDAQSPLKDKTLTVQGSGSVVVDPDIARITVGVMTSDADAVAAQDQNDAVMAGILAAVKGAGVAEKDIQTTQYNAYPRYNYESSYTTEIVGFEVTHMIRVTIRDIATVGQVLKAANQAGANQSYDISFDVEDRDAAYREALKEAIENAKEKAQAMAGPSGITLGDPAAVYEGGTAGTYGEMRGYTEGDYGLGGVPAQSGQLEVSASVTIVYNMQ